MLEHDFGEIAAASGKGVGGELSVAEMQLGSFAYPHLPHLAAASGGTRRRLNHSMSSKPIEAAFARVLAATAHLPGVEEGTSYGTPALNVRGKLFARLKDAGTLVMHSTIDEKEMLMQVDPKVYFETDHYKGWHVVLVRLNKISASKLRHPLEQAWRHKAPKRLVAAFDARR